jgi:hypothetical protein
MVECRHAVRRPGAATGPSCVADQAFTEYIFTAQSTFSATCHADPRMKEPSRDVARNKL